MARSQGDNGPKSAQPMRRSPLKSKKSTTSVHLQCLMGPNVHEGVLKGHVLKSEDVISPVPPSADNWLSTKIRKENFVLER